jgi:ABC-2 type transport system ATP-binding protein
MNEIVAHAGKLAATSDAQSDAVVSIRGVSKTYASGLQALKPIDLDIRRGEIFDGLDIQTDFRAARSRIGLVPQELATDRFESVWATVTFSRGLFGYVPNASYVEQVLRDLSLWEKRKDSIQSLSGGMKRRVMIAKALSHEPRILFLDEPTAGVDVELRRDMWALVRRLRDGGVTVILTTHYIDEAEEMADRIGVIRKGELIVVEDKATLMKKLGSKRLTLVLPESMTGIPPELADWHLKLSSSGYELEYEFDINREHTGVPSLLRRLSDLGIGFRDLNTSQSSLEDIFVSLVHEEKTS